MPKPSFRVFSRVSWFPLRSQAFPFVPFGCFVVPSPLPSGSDQPLARQVRPSHAHERPPFLQPLSRAVKAPQHVDVGQVQSLSHVGLCVDDVLSLIWVRDQVVQLVWAMRMPVDNLLSNWALTAISALLLLVTIDFLGFGDPKIPSLGRLLHESFGFGGFGRLAWWWILAPMVYLGLLALGLLLVSTGLDD